MRGATGIILPPQYLPPFFLDKNLLWLCTGRKSFDVAALKHEESLTQLKSRTKSLLLAEIIMSNHLTFSPFLAPSEVWASMKLTVSLQFLNLGQSVGLLRQVISSSQNLYLHRTTQT
jgi:hypothetical protein